MSEYTSALVFLLKVTNVIAAAALFTIASVISFNFFQSSGYNRPTTYLSVELLNPQPVYPGDRLTFRSHRIKHRFCPLRVDRAILSADSPHRVVASGFEIGGFSPVGEGYIDFAMYLPVDTPDGEYIFSQNITATCGETVFSDFTHPVKFAVVSRPAMR